MMWFGFFPAIDTALGISASYRAVPFEKVKKEVTEISKNLYCTQNGEPVPCDTVPDLTDTMTEQELQEKVKEYNENNFYSDVANYIVLNYTFDSIAAIGIDPAGFILGELSKVFSIAFGNPWQTLLSLWFAVSAFLTAVFTATLLPFFGIGSGA